MEERSTSDGEVPRSPRAFIPYVHEPESSAHRELVRQLWLFLRAQDIDADVDPVVVGQRQDWSLWIDQLRQADHVLLIASHGRRAATGQGVERKTGLLRDAFHQDKLNRFVPVILPGQSVDGLPGFLAPATTVYHVTAFTVTGAEPLLRLLTSNPPVGHSATARIDRVDNKVGRVQGTVVQAGSIRDVNLITGASVRTDYSQQVLRIAPTELRGREQELTELTRWCTDPATAGRYWWWRATAWSGKSALLSWFVLHPPPGVHVVSFFVTARLASQNDRAAFIDNLLEQLLALLGHTLPPLLTNNTREAHLLGLLAEAADACQARGAQFVLVVDGLDEDRSAHAGVEWHSIASLLPVTPPAGMRVVVASRADPPLPDDVAADHPMRDPDVRHLLEPSPYARGLREEMVRELDALLEGPPLGRDLLGLLVAAGGSLSAADLAELTGCPLRQVERYLKTAAARSFTSRPSHYRPATQPAIYLLAHEELDVAAREQIGRAALADYRDRLHTWAQRYRDRRWGEDTPQYLLRGYHDLLTQTGDMARLIACATDRDRQECLLRVSGGDAAALTEITQVMELCVNRPAPDLDTVVLLARHRDRLRDRNSDILPDVPALWVLLGQTTRAEALARSITNPGERTVALRLVAEAVTRNSDHGRVRSLLHEARTIADSIANPDERASALQLVAEAVARAGDHVGAEDIARSITDPDEQAWALRLVAEATAQTGDSKPAEDIAGRISHSDEKARALRSVAEALTRTGDYQRAERIARGITNPDEKARALRSVAEARTRAGENDRASTLLRDAETAAAAIISPGERASALRSIAESMARAGDHDEGRTLARSIPKSGERASALRLVAGAVAQAGDDDRARALLGDAEAAARSLINPAEQARALRSVAEALASTGDHDKAEKIARSIANPGEHALALQLTAEAVLRAGQHDRAEALLQDAETLARSITNTGERALALELMAEAVLRTGQHDRADALRRDAETIVGTITSSVGQASTIRLVAEAMARTGDHDRAERIARSIVHPDEQARALRSVVEALAKAGDHDRATALLHDLETISRSINHPFLRAEALRSIAEAMARTGDRAGAKVIARSITDPFLQAKALRSIAEAVVRETETDPDRRLRNVARLLMVARWYESAYDLVSLAPDALHEGIQELLADGAAGDSGGRLPALRPRPEKPQADVGGQ